MEETITKGTQKSQSRSRARARDSLGKRGSQSGATFFFYIKEGGKSRAIKKMAWLIITDLKGVTKKVKHVLNAYCSASTHATIIVCTLHFFQICPE